MTLARGGSSGRSFGPPGVDAPATPDTGPRPAGPAPTRVAVQNRVPRGRAGHAPDDREQWWRSCPTRSGSTAKRSRSQGDIATPGGSRSGQQEHQDATGQPPGQVPPQGGAMVDAVLHSLNRDDGPGSARGNAGTRPLASVGGGDLLCHAPHLERRAFATRTTPRAASSCGQGLLLGCALVSVLVLGCRLGPAPLKLVLL